MKQVLTGIAAASIVIGAALPVAMANSTTTFTKPATQSAHKKLPIVKAIAFRPMGATSLSGFKGQPVMKAGTETTPTWSQVEISVGGQVLSSPQAFHEDGETFLPIFDIDAALQKIGDQVAWNGETDTWNLQASSTVLEALAQTPGGSVGTGNTSVTVNGNLLAKIDTVDEVAPNTGTETAYALLDFIQAAFEELGAGVWDGNAQQLDINTPNFITSAIATNGSIILTFDNPFVVTPGTSELLVKGTTGSTLWATASPVSVSNIQLSSDGETITLTIPKNVPGAPAPHYTVSYMGENPVPVLAE